MYKISLALRYLDKYPPVWIKLPPCTKHITCIKHFRWGDCVVLLVLVLGEAKAGPRWSKEVQAGLRWSRDGPGSEIRDGPGWSKESRDGPRWSKEDQNGPANFRNGFAGNARALSSVSSVSFYVTEGSNNSKKCKSDIHYQRFHQLEKV